MSDARNVLVELHDDEYPELRIQISKLISDSKSTIYFQSLVATNCREVVDAMPWWRKLWR